MLLYHSTNQVGRDGIEAEGFALSHVGDSPEAAWFSAHPNKAIGVGTGWWVIVDLPADVAEEYRHYVAPGLPYLDNYKIPWHIVNQYQPFTYERWDPET